MIPAISGMHSIAHAEHTNTADINSSEIYSPPSKFLSNDKIKTIKPNDNHRPTAIAGMDKVAMAGQKGDS